MKKNYAKLALITLCAPALINSQTVFSEERIPTSEYQGSITKEKNDTDKNNSESTEKSELLDQEELKETNSTSDFSNESSSLNTGQEEASLQSVPEENTFSENKSDGEFIERTSESSDNQQEKVDQSLKAGTTYKWAGLTVTLDAEGTLHVPSGTANTQASDYLLTPETKKVIFEGPLTIIGSMADMFWQIGDNLSSIENLGNVDTSNVTTMRSAFQGCGGIKELDLSGWNTSNVTDFSKMFQGCYSLKSINLSNFDTSNAVQMNEMFSATGLENVNLSSFDTHNVEQMYGMFMGSDKLIQLDLSNFDTSRVWTMADMFSICSSLESLNLSSFDTTNVKVFKDIRRGFLAYCYQLKALKLGEKFNGTPLDNTEIGLPEHESSDLYDSTWQNVGNGTIDNPQGNNIWSSSELIKQYNGMADSDTYVWTPKANNMVNVTVKDSTITVGEEWNPIDNFVSATDKDGNPVDFSEVTFSGDVDTTKVGEYKVTYSYGGKTQEATITVKAASEDQTTITTKDSTITVGEEWNPIDNFVSATDKDGNPVDFSEVTVSGDVDTTKVGEYKVTYSYGGKTQEATITIKAASEDQTTITTKDSTITVGEEWNPIDNFVSATDKDGNPVDFSEVTVSGDVDTTKVGEYKVTYSYGGKTQEATITVKAASEGQPSVTTKGDPATGSIENGETNQSLPETGEKGGLLSVGMGASLLAITSYLFKRKK
ncbi:bacterial Ig-like domain-containing protein [Enterococcus faecalis]|uniref:bacterial Ig-like domain-containing protein n=1 Tax=Enterococcus faecalis TaxID=1351 RepID=UPI0021C8E552|nr:bacterial Ig-like domain-containing protein [Enterococcus faecalis]